MHPNSHQLTEKLDEIPYALSVASKPDHDHKDASISKLLAQKLKEKAQQIVPCPSPQTGPESYLPASSAE